MTLIIKGCAKLRAFTIPWDIFGYLSPSFSLFPAYSHPLPVDPVCSPHSNNAKYVIWSINANRSDRTVPEFLGAFYGICYRYFAFELQRTSRVHRASALKILFRRILSAFIPLIVPVVERFLILPLSLSLSFPFFLSMYISSSSMSCGGNYGAVTQNQIEEMCEASLMFTRASQAAASRRLSCV